MSTHPIDRYFPQWTEADRLRRIRRDTGLTQAAFAQQLGIKTERYSAWESGRNQPPMRDFIAAAKRIELAFGVAAEWTLGLAASEPDPEGGATGGESVGLHSADRLTTQEYVRELRLMSVA